ncbi:MAG: PfkB family carbohydrate kinase [Acidobacteria bacterium]|nr:PfkB family carbohydrate kinase [Acidobacteriota bacterium]
MTESERLSALVGEFPRRGVVVVGDLVADQFVYGEIGRVSREAPVLILRHERTETVPGGAANCAANLATLGARVALVGLIGDDEPGRALVASLRETGVDCEGVVCDKALRTTTKVRILAGHAHGLRQQVIRLDYEGRPHADESLAHELAARLHDAADDADAFVVSDYNYGVAAGETLAALRESARERGVPVLVDSRFRLTEFTHLTSATPNEDEVEHVLGRRLGGDDDSVESAARELLERLAHDALLVTRGSNGMLLVERGGGPVHIPVVGSREAVDVTGAGDTVIAAYSLALACGASFADAARLANRAGGLAVMKRGTACVTAAELLASLAGHGGE